MSKITNVRHALLGIAISPRGFEAGGKTVDEVNDIVSGIAKDFDEIQFKVVRNHLDENGVPSFVLNEYVFVKYAEEVTATKSKKADA